MCLKICKLYFAFLLKRAESPILGRKPGKLLSPLTTLPLSSQHYQPPLPSQHLHLHSKPQNVWKVVFPEAPQPCSYGHHHWHYQPPQPNISTMCLTFLQCFLSCNSQGSQHVKELCFAGSISYHQRHHHYHVNHPPNLFRIYNPESI